MRRKLNRKLDMRTRFIRAKRRNLVDASPGIHSCILILDGLKPDFNIGKIFRAADAFSALEIHLINVEFFDPDPAKGSVRWVPFFQHDGFDTCYQEMIGRGYECITLEPGQDQVLGGGSLPKKAAFVFGHEEFGLSFDRASYPAMTSVSIPQWGYVQSLNVSVAASIVLYEYVRRYGRPLAEGRTPRPAAVNTGTGVPCSGLRGGKKS
ncbi:MAG TPA: TrmH family RNA methyltransferase [Desulfobulbus sp.]|nr:TrmH family RNA methyltransferase [Desulfobulbus sp.]